MNYVIAYGTRKGATRETARILGNELKENHRCSIRIMDAKNVSDDDLSWADRLVIGTSIVMGRWKRSCKRLVKQAGKESKPTAIYVYAAVTLSEKIPDEKPKKKHNKKSLDRVGYEVEECIDPVCGKCHLNPIAKTAFGGRLSFFGHDIINNHTEAPIKAWANHLSKIPFGDEPDNHKRPS